MAEDQKIIEAFINDIGELGLSTDPYKWVLYCFNWGQDELADYTGPDDWQIDILKSIRDKLRAGEIGTQEAIQIAVASGHGIGKSALVSWLILWAMSTFEDTKGIVTANTETQLRTKTWAELSKWFRLCLIKDMFTVTATAIFSNSPNHEKTWRIDMIPWSEQKPESFAGMHNKGKRILIIFDEASAISDVIWEVTEGALTDSDTQIMWFAFGNPTRNTGRFKECFSGKFAKRWLNKQIDGRDARMTNKELIKQWIEDYGLDSDFVKVRVRGMFPSMSMRQLIAIEDVDSALGRQLRVEQFNFAPKIITCDPAWEGDDSLEIGLRQGLYFRILRSIPKNDNDIEIANIIANLENEHNADAVIIDAGYGTGIVSAGRTMGRTWYAIWFSGKSPDPACLNMRAYMWKEMRDWLKSGGAIPDDKQLYADLIGPEVVPRTDGKIQLESKKDMKKRGLPSPNKADALALSFAISIMGKTDNKYFANKLQFATAGYNPISRNDNRHFANSSFNPIQSKRRR